METDATTVIRLRGFEKRYRRQVAVRGVDLEVRSGEIYGLIGPDGAGKSSLMKAVAGVLAHDGGRVEVFGITVDSEAAAERIKGRIGFMPQGLGLNLYPELSVEENIDFFARLREVPAAELARRKAKLLAMTRLAPFRDRPMKHLSGGMKQKLGLVCTLIHEPELVILDEPTTGVDPVSRRDFWAILAEMLRERGITTLVSTAYLDEADRFHRLSLLYEGTVLATGEPDQLRAHAGGDDTDLEQVFVSLLRDQGVAEEVTASVPSTTTPGNEAAIEARELTRDFGHFRAVDRVSFRVRRGEIFGLLGANGAGKTTVIKMLTGILPPTSGSGQVAGADMGHAGHRIKRRIGYMSQAFSLYRDLSVMENLRLFAGIYGVPRRQRKARLRQLIDTTGLAGNERRLAGDLPMGIRQRLALACALVHRPRVLFLDEPTSGVDPLGRRRFWNILLRMAREEGVAILITTHYMSEAEQCDLLALMHAGRIIADASPTELKARLERDAGKLLELDCDRPLVALETLEAAGYRGVSLFGRKLHLLSRRPERAREKIEILLRSKGVRLLALRPRPPTLEDVFIYRILEQEAAS